MIYGKKSPNLFLSVKLDYAQKTTKMKKLTKTRFDIIVSMLQMDHELLERIKAYVCR